MSKDKLGSLELLSKFPNFGPHGSFDHYFWKGLLSLNGVVQKNEKNNTPQSPIFRAFSYPFYWFRRFASGLFLNYPRSLAREMVARTTPLCTPKLLSVKKENTALSRLTELRFLIYWPGKTVITQHQINIQNCRSETSSKLSISQHNSDCPTLHF